jgi:hypothetical protein
LDAGTGKNNHEHQNPSGGNDWILIALGLLIIRPLRRKKLIENEVSALRNLGSGRESA